MSTNRKAGRVTSIRLNDADRRAADRIRAEGKYLSRSEAIKAAIHLTDVAFSRRAA